MRCPRCQHENEAGAKFCEECATPLARACAKCGRPLSPTAKFCPECAHPTGLSAAPPAAQRFDSPESYTPKHLAERILTSKAALEGERKQVTVLFADLKGSMELLADRDPEEARKLLDPVLEQMMEAVHRYEGTVNQVMGDGIMALFGAPVAHEDHAVRACYAALRMQESVGRHADQAQRAGGVPVQIRVGLNSGEVVVRSIGSDLRMDYTAVGQTTHLAARTEQIARAGSILITGSTLRLAEGHVVVNPLGPVPVKGLEAPVDVYELTVASAARSRLQAAAARGLTRFVGRDAEMEALRVALERASQGHGQVVATVGEPGVGKSRLFWELTHSHRTHGWLVLESGSVSYGKATPYLPAVDLLKGYFRVHDRDTRREVQEKVTGKLLALDRTLEPALPAFLGLLDVPTEDAEWQGLEPHERRQRTLDAVKRVLLRESRAQPVLLVFEDLHWIDSETQALLNSLVESLPGARILLLVNYRPEYTHSWGSRTHYSQLRVDPLPAESAEALLTGLLGGHPSLEALRRLLLERTEGNPFFLEESARSLVESGALAGERGAHRLARPLEGGQMPPTVQAVLAARIDRLPPSDKHLLQAAAAIGKDVPLVLLEAIGGLAPDGLRAGLVRLKAGEFLYEASLFPEVEYTFKHALTHEVAYGALLHARRRDLHTSILEATERLYAGRLDEQVERLVQHALRGEMWDKAAVYARQAGIRAEDRSAYQSALPYFDQSLEALGHLPESREILERRLETMSLRGSALFVLGHREQLLASCDIELPLAETLRNREQLARVTNRMGTALFLSAEYVRALPASERGLAIADEIGAQALRITARLDVGQIRRSLGDFRGAAAVLSEALALLVGDLERQRLNRAFYPAISLRSTLGACLVDLGEFERATAVAHEAVDIAESLRHAAGLVVASGSASRLLIAQGRFADAIPPIERALELSRQAGIPLLESAAAGNLGHAYTMAGRLADGLPLIEQSVERVQRANRPAETQMRLHLAGAYVSAGRLDEAATVAELALTLARERSERGVEAQALRLLGDISRQRDPGAPEAAAASLRDALALAGELSMRPLAAHCHLGLGKLYRRTGDAAKAAEHLTAATTMYRDMDMRFWLEKADAELGGVER